MRYENPTSVKLGMAGEFVGKRYRVVGRVVMSMEEAGGTYYWNEFHLVGDDGRDATLVYEETENGPQWRLFTLLEPAPPLTVAEAAARRVGDTFQLEDETLRITCVDESRVCAIEGEAPEGVEQGDVARYFNAESGSEMIVVSWTGDELEVYRGITLPGHAVRSAFGITDIPSGALDHLSGAPADAKKMKGWMIFIALLTTIAAILSVRLTRSPSSKLPRLPKAQLTIGSTGRLNAAPYQITGRAEIEIDSVGRRYLRHEYSAIDDTGNESLIWQGTEQGADKWMLMTPITPTHGLTPQAAGALRLGDGIVVDEASLRVTQHFLTRVQKVTGATGLSPGGELYGFTARGTNGVVVARWNETAITFYRAISPSEKNPARAFR